MNGFERIWAALDARPADRVPVMLHNFMMAAREAGFTQSEFRADPRKIADAFVRSVERYRYDGIVVDIDTAVVASALGVPTSYPDDKPARTHGPLLGELSDDQIEGLRSVEIERHPRVEVLLESVRLLKEHVGDDAFVRGNCDQAPFSLASMVRSVETWMLDIAVPESREAAHRLLDVCADVACRVIRLMAQTGCDMVSNGDSPAGPSMISPAMYREFAMPYERRCVEEAHRHQLPYALHICGDTTAILEAMLETGTDAVELDYLTDLEVAHDVCRERVCFIGNLDPSGVLALGSPGEVETKTRRLLRVFSDTPRFILNAGCAIPAETPSENIHTMISTARH